MKQKTRYGVRPSAALAKANPAPVKAKTRTKSEQSSSHPSEMQGEYDAFVNACYGILFGGKSFDSTLKMITAHGNPVQGLATAVAMIVIHVREGYQKQRKPQPLPPVVQHGAMELLGNIAIASTAAGIHTFPPKELVSAAQMAAQLWQAQAQQMGIANPSTGGKTHPKDHKFTRVLSAKAFTQMIASAHSTKQEGKRHPQQPQPQPQQQQGAMPPTQGLLTQGASA